MKMIDETGNVYGYLTVIERGPNKGDRATWKCKCKCGNEVIVTGKLLRNGHTKSCGCLKKEVTTERNLLNGGGDLTGQRFGKLVVIEFYDWKDHNNGHKDRLWKCQCDCGNVCIVNHRYLRNGDTASCGCSHSKGNATITRILNQSHINYKSEYSFSDLKTGNNHYFYFDFALFDEQGNFKALIEYQGSIHFKFQGGWNSEESLKDVQRRDKIKKDYCEKNNIKLYYITYLEDIEERMVEILDEQYGTSNK